MLQPGCIYDAVFCVGANLLRDVEVVVNMKRIFEFLGIIGLLLCILAAFSLAELAYGETINYVQEHQYYALSSHE